jgi:hypothetical protein
MIRLCLGLQLLAAATAVQRAAMQLAAAGLAAEATVTTKAQLQTLQGQGHQDRVTQGVLTPPMAAVAAVAVELEPQVRQLAVIKAAPEVQA